MMSCVRIVIVNCWMLTEGELSRHTPHGGLVARGLRAGQNCLNNWLGLADSACWHNPHRILYAGKDSTRICLPGKQRPMSDPAGHSICRVDSQSAHPLSRQFQRVGEPKSGRQHWQQWQNRQKSRKTERSTSPDASPNASLDGQQKTPTANGVLLLITLITADLDGHSVGQLKHADLLLARQPLPRRPTHSPDS